MWLFEPLETCRAFVTNPLELVYPLLFPALLQPFQTLHYWWDARQWIFKHISDISWQGWFVSAHQHVGNRWEEKCRTISKPSPTLLSWPALFCKIKKSTKKGRNFAANVCMQENPDFFPFNYLISILKKAVADLGMFFTGQESSRLALLSSSKVWGKSK